MSIQQNTLFKCQKGTDCDFLYLIMSDVGEDHDHGGPVGQAGDDHAEEDLLLFYVPVVWFPMFDVAHFFCAALQLRKEHGQQFSRYRHSILYGGVGLLNCEYVGRAGLGGGATDQCFVVYT